MTRQFSPSVASHIVVRCPQSCDRLCATYILQQHSLLASPFVNVGAFLWVNGVMWFSTWDCGSLGSGSTPDLPSHFNKNGSLTALILRFRIAVARRRTDTGLLPLLESVFHIYKYNEFFGEKQIIIVCGREFT